MRTMLTIKGSVYRLYAAEIEFNAAHAVGPDFDRTPQIARLKFYAASDEQAAQRAVSLKDFPAARLLSLRKEIENA